MLATNHECVIAGPNEIPVPRASNGVRATEPDTDARRRPHDDNVGGLGHAYISNLSADQGLCGHVHSGIQVR